MGIDNRDWYKDDARRRFRASSALKAQRESEVRSKLDRFTQALPKGKAHPGQRGAWFSAILLWLGLGTLGFAFFTWLTAPKVTVAGSRVEVIIPKAPDGHHYIDGVLNGKRLRFLIDTGASYVAIGANLAADAGLLAGKPTRFETANGPVIGQLFEQQSIQIGGLATPPLTVSVMPNAPNAALLGQNFLRHVEMLQVDNKLVLRGRYAGQPVPPAIASAKTLMYAGLAMLFVAWLASFMFRNGRDSR